MCLWTQDWWLLPSIFPFILDTVELKIPTLQLEMWQKHKRRVLCFRQAYLCVHEGVGSSGAQNQVKTKMEE